MLMNLVPYVVSVVIAEGAGILGSVFTARSVSGWYATLSKPSWTPPGWLFGPVWTVLFALMGIAAGLVWEKRAIPGATLALSAYAVQLLLNVFWSVLFFGFRRPDLAYLEILALLVAIVVTTALFFRIDSRAGMLMLPYIAWVSFASFLNLAVWRMNGGDKF
ncbi:MAG: tryptophan-rich sensory protein [Candidatus Moranbacteria bacterium]|nr:tryptophan-rich sensory protein [Candidatus Moranbacteria bacterium]